MYDPNTTYADPNVQAWAQYYAHGGTDPTGSVYFISVPGVKEGPPPVSRNQSVDSITSPDGTPVGQAAQTAPLNIHKGPEQSQPQATMWATLNSLTLVGNGTTTGGEQFSQALQRFFLIAS